jgi:hypothetical protein
VYGLVLILELVRKLMYPSLRDVFMGIDDGGTDDVWASCIETIMMYGHQVLLETLV